MFLCFDEPFSKRLQRVAQFVKKHEKSSIWPKLCNFSNKLSCLCILINFLGKSCKKCLISWKNTKNHRFGQNLQLLEQTTMSWHFHELFSKKLQKVPHFVKKHGKSSISRKLATFRKNYHVFTFRWTFRQTVAKTASFCEKARKLIDFGQNYATFSNKLPCFGVSMNFWAKGCKKLLNSWKSTKNHRFGQNYATFRTNYHVLAISWTFQKEVAKSASFREKARKIIDLANTMQLFEQTTMFLHFDELLRKRLEKVVHSVKKHERSWIWSNLQLFEQTTMFLPVDELYSKQSQKLPHFVKKHENSSIWPKLCNFFEQTTMFSCFDELFSKRLQKVAQFVKKHEKSSIWPKVCNFSNKLPCLCISINFSGKSCKKSLIS